MAKVKWPSKACKKVLIPLYGGTMAVFYDKPSFAQAHYCLTGTEVDLEGCDGCVRTYSGEGIGSPTLVGIFNSDPEVICHEAVHVAQFTMEDVGADDFETQAYLAQWAFGFIFKNLPKEVKDETTSN